MTHNESVCVCENCGVRITDSRRTALMPKADQWIVLMRCPDCVDLSELDATIERGIASDVRDGLGYTKRQRRYLLDHPNRWAAIKRLCGPYDFPHPDGV